MQKHVICKRTYLEYLLGFSSSRSFPPRKTFFLNYVYKSVSTIRVCICNLAQKFCNSRAYEVKVYTSVSEHVFIISLLFFFYC